MSYQESRTEICSYPGCKAEVLTKGVWPYSCLKEGHKAAVEGLKHAMANTELLTDSIRFVDAKTRWIWGPRDSEGRGVFQLGELAGIGAYSGEGKTTFGTQLAINLAVGTQFLGVDCVGPMKTLVISEAPRKQIGLQAKWAGIDEEQAENVRICYIPTISAAVLEMLISKYEPEKVDLDTLTAIVPTLGVHGPGIFDWNNPTHLTEVTGFFRRLIRDYKLKLMLCWVHTTKASFKKGKPEQNLAAFSGSQALVTQFDSAYLIARDKSGEHARFFRVKSRFSHETIEEIRYCYDESNHQLVELDGEASTAMSPAEKAQVGAEILAGVPKGLSFTALGNELRKRGVSFDVNKREEIREALKEVTEVGGRAGRVVEEKRRMVWREVD